MNRYALAQLADFTLNLLTETKDWDSDTTDAIAAEAQRLGLASNDDEGYFARHGRALEDTRPIRMAVILEGGLVQEVVSDAESETFTNVELLVIDYDTEGADPADIHQVVQSDGISTERAYVRYEGIEPARLNLASVVDLLEGRAEPKEVA